MRVLAKACLASVTLVGLGCGRINFDAQELGADQPDATTEVPGADAQIALVDAAVDAEPLGDAGASSLRAQEIGYAECFEATQDVVVGAVTAAVGDTVIVQIVQEQAFNGANVSDSKGNLYSLIESTSVSGIKISVFASALSDALVTGDTITGEIYATAVQGGQSKAVLATTSSVLATVLPNSVVRAPIATDSGSTADFAVVFTNTAGDFNYCAGATGSAGTLTLDSAWTQVAEKRADCNGEPSLELTNFAYTLEPATGAPSTASCAGTIVGGDATVRWAGVTAKAGAL